VKQERPILAMVIGNKGERHARRTEEMARDQRGGVKVQMGSKEAGSSIICARTSAQKLDKGPGKTIKERICIIAKQRGITVSGKRNPELLHLVALNPRYSNYQDLARKRQRSIDRPHSALEEQVGTDRIWLRKHVSCSRRQAEEVQVSRVCLKLYLRASTGATPSLNWSGL